LHVSLLVIVCAVAQIASPAAADGDQQLAKASQNPVANMISVPFENNLYFDAGPSEKLANVLNVKPVIPVGLGRFNLVNRFVVPVVWLEAQDRMGSGRGNADLGYGEAFPGTSSQFGLGNTSYQGFLSPGEPGPVIWGVGPALVLPTNTDDSLGSDTWSAGVSALILTMPGKWVVGALLQQVWSFATHGDAADVNSFLIQPIANYNLPKGWYLSSVPVITANWEAESGQRWTVPVGGGIGKIHRFGKQAVDFRLASFYHVERPEFGPRWNLQLTVKLLFPK
jgi:hypothetical protein